MPLAWVFESFPPLCARRGTDMRIIASVVNAAPIERDFSRVSYAGFEAARLVDIGTRHHCAESLGL